MKMISDCVGGGDREAVVEDGEGVDGCGLKQERKRGCLEVGEKEGASGCVASIFSFKRPPHTSSISAELSPSTQIFVFSSCVALVPGTCTPY